MSPDDNVTAFPGASELPENPMQIAPARPGYCDHAAVTLDPHTRTVQCANVACGAVLDPFHFLHANARTIATAWQNYRAVSNQAREIAERVHVLKKEEARLRAMIKRLQEKSGAVVNVRGGE